MIKNEGEITYSILDFVNKKPPTRDYNVYTQLGIKIVIKENPKDHRHLFLVNCLNNNFLKKY